MINPSDNKPRPRVSRNCGNCRAVKRRVGSSFSSLFLSPRPVLLTFSFPPIQCDQQVPHCGQCIRTREKCSGYRDEWELVFHDQTSKTIKRSKAKRASKSPTNATKSTTTTTTAAVNRVPSPPSNTLKPSVDDLGINYFFHQFVCGGRSNTRGCLNYIPSVYHADGAQSTLVTSMAAVGLVALANSTQRPELANHARIKYMQAIHLVSNALASPVEYVKDSTLMSVISLGVFEHVSAYESFTRHVQGAAALVIARGKAQFSSPVGMLMFNQVRTDLVLASFQTDMPIPEKILELQEEVGDHPCTSMTGWTLGMLALQTAVLLLNIKKNTVTEKRAWLEMLDETVALEKDFESLVEPLSIQEPYKTVRLPGRDPNITNNGLYRIYKDSWSIRLWTNLRTLQMVASEMKLFVLSKMLSRRIPDDVREQTKLDIGKTLQTLSYLGEEILAIVPQGLEFISLEEEAEPCPSIGLIKVSGGYLLVWGLYMVGKSLATNKENRRYAIRLLRDIGLTTGISVALRLVEEALEVDRMTSGA